MVVATPTSDGVVLAKTIHLLWNMCSSPLIIEAVKLS